MGVVLCRCLGWRGGGVMGVEKGRDSGLVVGDVICFASLVDVLCTWTCQFGYCIV
jgi:hypothetical protein